MKKLTISITVLIIILLSACDKYPNKSIVESAEQGDISSVKQLIMQGESPDSVDNCLWSPLMKAAQNGHLDVVNLLLLEGVQVDQLDKGGYTALLLASSRNQDAIVDVLIKHGANINHQEQSMGWTALIWAAKLNFTETVSALLKHQADITIKDFSGKTALDWATQNKNDELIRVLKKDAR